MPLSAPKRTAPPGQRQKGKPVFDNPLDAKSPRKETSAVPKEKSTLPPKSVSLKHVAAHVGLSIAAVSRVLSHAPAAQSIPEPTRRRILDAARLLNYQPNALARSLRSRRSLTLGVMLPEISEGYATLVLSGIEERLIAEGYFYLLASHHHRPDLIDSYQRLLLARAIEGLLVIDTPLDQRPAVPTIAISGRHTHDGVSSVVLNHELAGRLALTHLRTLGHRRIAFLKGQPFSSDTQSRWLGIRHAAKALDIEIDAHLVVALEGDQPDHTPGYLATRALLAAGRPFTALFAFNDIAAIGAILALREAGLRVPEDVSVIGFDDIQGAAFQHPALTTIRQPLRQMGALAAQAILHELKSPGAPIQRIVVDPELIVRDSTGPAPQPASRTKK